MQSTAHPSRTIISGRISVEYYLKAIFAVAHRLFFENIRVYPWSFFAARVVSSFFTVILAYFMYHVLFSGRTVNSFQIYTGSSDYLTYLVIGVSIQAYADGALLSLGRSLVIERRIGTIECLFLTPVPLSAFLLGVMLQQALLTTVDFLVVILISLPFGLDLSLINWPAFVLILLIGQVGFMGIGILLSALMLYLRDTYLTQNTALTLLFFLCGVLFPIEYLPGWLQVISNLIPITHTLTLARRSALLGTSIAQQWPDILWLLGLSLIYCILGLLSLYWVRKASLEINLS